MKNRIIRRGAGLLSVLFSSLLLLTACGGETKKAVEPKEAEKEVVEEEPSDPHAGQVRSVLTGQWIDPSKSTVRPFAVMFENSKASQPHYGINTASIIYEAPVEGGITREMAVFEDLGDLKQVGNVRSCRPYYVYLAAEYGAIYCHFGQSAQGKEVLATGIVPDLNGLGKAGNIAYYRSNDKKAPHNAYTSSEGLRKAAEKLGFDLTYDPSQDKHLTFAEDGQENTLPGGTACNKAALYFYDNKPSFTYNPSTGLYERAQFGRPEIDQADNGAVVAVKNVILETVPSSMYDEKHLNLGLTGEGHGKYLTNGKMIDITWKKEGETAGTHYFTSDGKELVLNQGRTWISLIEDKHEGENSFS